MSYQTYITDALVCGSRSYRTADRSYLLFTREAGMLTALAKSVREERSKQRFGLQEFSLIRVTLVRGREVWRITGVEPVENLYFSSDNRARRLFIRRAIQSLRRVIHGEVSHPELFDDLLHFCRLVPPETAGVLQVAFLLRMLHMLGYVAPDALLLPICTYRATQPDLEEIAMHTKAHLVELEGRIVSALEHSHL